MSTLPSIPEVSYTGGMALFSLITGNQHKVAEWQRLMPKNMAFDHQAIDLEELQSLDSREIVSHKLRQAFDIVGSPVVVEDVSFGLDQLHGLPGPFIKFFYEKLGADALYQLAGKQAPASATCVVGYYDGRREIIVSGSVHGTAVAARGTGFGVDPGFVPDGFTITCGEMTAPQKDAMSHRRQAIDKLVAQLAP